MPNKDPEAFLMHGRVLGFFLFGLMEATASGLWLRVCHCRLIRELDGATLVVVCAFGF